MTKTNDTTQEIYMNYVKAFAIIAMVCGHAGSTLIPYIYQYHMSLFMFVAGYFYKEYYSEHPIILLKKRIKTLYIPFFCYNIVFIFVSSICNNLKIANRGRYIIGNIDIKQMFKSLLSFNSYADYLGGFWFVKTLFLTTIMFCMISFILKKITDNIEIYRCLSVVCIYIIIWILFDDNLVLKKNIIQVSMSLPIFYSGYMYKKYKEKINLNMLSFVMALWIVYINAQNGIVDIDSLTFTGPVFYLMSSLAGIYVNVGLAKFLFNKFGNIAYINFIGKSTYAILAIHLLTQDILINLIKVNGINIGEFLWLVDVVVAVNVSIFIRYLYICCKKYIKAKGVKENA